MNRNTNEKHICRRLGNKQKLTENLLQTIIDILEELRRTIYFVDLEDIYPNDGNLKLRIDQCKLVKNWIYQNKIVLNENYRKANAAIAAEGTEGSNDLALRLMHYRQLKKFKWTGYTHFYVDKTFEARSLSSSAKEETIRELIKIDINEGKVLSEIDLNQNRLLILLSQN